MVYVILKYIIFHFIDIYPVSTILVLKLSLQYDIQASSLSMLPHTFRTLTILTNTAHIYCAEITNGNIKECGS